MVSPFYMDTEANNSDDNKDDANNSILPMHRSFNHFTQDPKDILFDDDLQQQAESFYPSLETLKPCPKDIRNLLWDNLSQPEKVVLKLSLQGVSLTEMAIKLKRSPITLSRYLKTAKLKFNITSKDHFVCIITLYLIYGFALNLRTIGRLVSWSRRNFGNDSNVTKELNDRFFATLRREREQKKINQVQKVISPDREKLQ